MRATNIDPVLLADPPGPPPMNATTWSTSGSALTTATARSCRSRIAGNAMSCGASVKPISMPVSCCGKRPFGTLMKRKTVSPTVTAVTASVRPRCASTQVSARS